MAAPGEVVGARTFPAPRERLFDAFADPAQLARWWGPHGFANEFRTFDLRPGGRWRFDMIGPDGARIPQDKTFVEVERPARVVLHHAQEGHDFHLTMTYDDVAGGTRLTWRMRFATPAQLAAVRQAVVAGIEQNFDRLAAHLAAGPAHPGDAPMDTLPMPPHAITVERTFRAPRERVWRAFTDPRMLARWWTPPGGEASHVTVDLRVGGRFHYLMRMPDGTEVWGRGEYVELRAPERLAYVDAFSDREGNVVPPARYGMSEAHPVESLVTVDFAEVDGGTRVTLRHAIGAHVPERQGTNDGWNAMLDALGGLLAADAAATTGA